MKLFQGALMLLAWLTIALNPLFSNRWLCDKTWRCLLFARYSNYAYIGNTAASALTQDIKNSYVGPFDVTVNAHGVYYTTFTHQCPCSGKRRNVHYFYQNTNQICLAMSRAVSDESDMYAKSAQMVERRLVVCRKKTNVEQEQQVEKKMCDRVYQKIEEGNNKRINKKGRKHKSLPVLTQTIPKLMNYNHQMPATL